MRLQNSHAGFSLLLVLAVGAGAAALAACDADAVQAVDRPRVHGIVEWANHPFGEGDGPGGQMAPAGAAVAQQDEIPGVIDPTQSPLRAQIYLPGDVQAGVPVVVTITTIGPSMCWIAAALDVEGGSNHVELEVWDRGPALGDRCEMQLNPLARTVELTFPEPGEGSITLIGRRVGGTDAPIHEDWELGEVHEIQVTFPVE